MEIDERAIWNQKFSEKSHASLEPDPFLVSAYDELLSGLPAGTALDVAGGAGRHSIWLAQRGWHARLLDISDVGIGLAERNASRSLGPIRKEFLIHAEVADLNRMQSFGVEQYDLVLVFFYLQRELFPALISALKPGGFLLYKTYTTDQQNLSDGPHNPVFLLKPNELLHAFQSLRALHYHETAQNKATAELVAQKPKRSSETNSLPT
ncbi:MAG TPA: class I SAM-dependent methyltransferase [Candidatus Angelobacter sp.]|nr:class I SAM-dependent methyltransferase [Candidatus Angelobacter sp.]